MKRTLCLILAVLIAISFPACHYSKSGDILEPVDFYYPRKTASFVYGTPDSVIVSEVREASGHIDDLNYLLTMYLRGPQDETLRSPFPTGCSLEEVYTKDDTLYVRFSSEFAQLDGTELTIASAALVKTFLSITGLSYVCIDAESPKKTINLILNAESILFADYSIFATQAAE